MEALRRHREIMERLMATLGLVTSVHPGDVLLEIELPRTLMSPDRLEYAYSVSKSVRSRKDGGSEKSVLDMLRDVRWKIARLSAMQEAFASEKKARQWSTAGVTRAYHRARKREERQPRMLV